MDELKQKLIDTANASGLPFEAVYYVIKDFYRDATESYKSFLESQKQTEVKETEAE